MEHFHYIVNSMMELWYDMYDTGQQLFVFFTTPVQEQVSEGDDFLGILSGIESTPFEMIFSFGLISIMMAWLVKFFKIV